MPMNLDEKKIILSIIKKLYPLAQKCTSTLDFDDLQQEAWLVLERARLNFDANKGIKFTTYAYQVIYRRLLHILRRESEFLEETKHIPPWEYNTSYEPNYSDTLNVLLSKLQNTDDKNLIKDYYVHGKTFAILGAQHGITAQGVKVRLNKILEKLRHEISQDNYSHRV